MSADIAIETRDLTKYYGPVRGVEDVRLTVHQGEVFGLLGPNGAGKTTVIRLLLGFIRPTAGSASVFGLDVWQDAPAVKRWVAYQPAQAGLYSDVTGRDLLAFLSRWRGAEMVRRGEELARRLQVDLDQKTRSLSRGSRQKLGLVLAFATTAPLLLLDEPSTGLDPLMQLELVQMVREEKARGRTILLASHNLMEVERVCDRVAMIREGRLLTVEQVADLRLKTMRQMELTFAQDVDPARLNVPGVTVLEREGRRLRLGVKGPVGPLIKALAQLDVVEMTFPPPGLEDLFLQYYAPGPWKTPSSA